jgi:uncharacterized protein (UPF0212 family)
MVTSLTEQFKLQRIQIHEVTEVYTGFYNKLNLGVETTTALTNTTISSLAALSEGRIAAYLSITGGGTGSALSDRLMSFYNQTPYSQTDTRLNLAQNTLNILGQKFKSSSMTEFAKTRLTMQIFGIKDMETGARLAKAVSAMNDTGVDTNAAVNEARDILQETNGAEDQVMNLVTNAVFAALRFLGSIAGFFGGGAVKAMIGSSLSPLETQLAKVNTAMNNTTKATSTTFDDLVGNTSVLDVIATSTTATAQFTEQAVQIAKSQVGATMTAAAVTAAAAPGPSSTAASAALAAAKGKLTQLGEAQIAPYTSVVIGISDKLKDVLKITKTVSNKSESLNSA